jgi:hypothetical protein
MGNLCCAREHSVQFFMQFIYTVKLHSLTSSVWGPLEYQQMYSHNVIDVCRTSNHVERRQLQWTKTAVIL